MCPYSVALGEIEIAVTWENRNRGDGAHLVYHLLLEYWRQQIAAAVKAKDTVFVGQIPNADAAAACGGFKASKPTRFPKYNFFDPRLARGSMAQSKIRMRTKSGFVVFVILLMDRFLYYF